MSVCGLKEVCHCYVYHDSKTCDSFKRNDSFLLVGRTGSKRFDSVICFVWSRSFVVVVVKYIFG